MTIQIFALVVEWLSVGMFVACLFHEWLNEE